MSDVSKWKPVVPVEDCAERIARLPARAYWADEDEPMLFLPFGTSGFQVPYRTAMELGLVREVEPAPETLEQHLKDHPPKGFRPVPHYNRGGDSISCYFADERAVSETVNEFLTLHRSMATGVIVGCTIHGVKAMVAEKDGRS